MKSEDVAQYLRNNPVFFEQYADMLSEIYIPHPHGGRAIALADRQVLTLREKNRALEAKLAELLQFGEENDAIGEKMHRLGLALLGAADLPAVANALYYNLREDFAVPHAGLRLWRGAGDASEFIAVSEELRAYASGLEHPYCGPGTNVEMAAWFGDAAPLIRSVAVMPLKDEAAFGLLVLASEDAARFYPEMGTLYLKRLGELAGTALLRFL